MLRLKLFLLSIHAYALMGLASSPPIDTVALETVQVSAYSLSQFTVGNKIEKIGSKTIQLYKNNSLAELLQSTQLAVNTYGSGSLASTSIRGSGTSHTAVLWNGFNIQNTLNGGVNLAHLPLSFMDNVSIQYGGCSALFGSGAVGGIIHLNNELQYNKGVSVMVGQESGSFHRQQHSSRIDFSNRWYAGSIRFAHHSMKNNFPFKNIAEFGTPVDTQKNASSLGNGFLSDNQFRFGNHQFTSHFWIQDYKYEIPSPMTVTSDQGKQKSNEIRNSLEWQYVRNAHTFYVRHAFFQEHMQYRSLIDSGNHIAKTFITEAEGRFKPSNSWIVRYGINNTNESGKSNYFDQLSKRNRTAIYSSLKYSTPSRKHTMMLNLREEFVNGKSSPITFSSGINTFVSEYLTIKNSFSRNYRLPDFNAIYWAVWGNPDLLPESGYSADAGYSFKKKNDKTEFNFSQTLFASYSQNLIVWQPSGSLWHPYNVNQSYALGIENNMGIKRTLGNILYEMQAGYSFTDARKLVAENENAASQGKQLLYVPKHKASLSIGGEYQNYSLTYHQNFTGIRYTDAENLFFVKSYFPANLSFNKKISFAKSSITVGALVNNIWNSDYQVMAWYPMPGRNYSARLMYTFN